MLLDPLLHIHSTPGQPCVACGDADDGSRLFTTDVGMWNREVKTCLPGGIVEPSYVLSSRSDARASALKDERFPDWNKVRDQR